MLGGGRGGRTIGRACRSGPACQRATFDAVRRLRLPPYRRTAAREREEQGKRSGTRRPGRLGAVESRLGRAGCGRVLLSGWKTRAGCARARVQGQGRAGWRSP